MSQRSPNFEHPIPRMTTLSRMPCGMSVPPYGRNRRRGLPEIAAEAALRVDVLDAEHHPHRLSDREIGRIDVGEIHHPAAAVLELDHVVARRRIWPISQAVGRVGSDAPPLLGETVP